MPNTAKKAEPPTEEERQRIVVGVDPDRFYCPHPGCNRSFAELWRLKVHYRAPPDVRGSGKERGHGTELKFCPKCGKDLRPGKHHVGCSAGKSAPRQAAKRQRQQMSATTESAAEVTAPTTTEHTSSSWEQAVRRQAVKQRQASEADSVQQRVRRAEGGCRIETLVQNLDARHVGGADLLFHPNLPPSSSHVLGGEPGAAGQGQPFGAAQQPAAQQQQAGPQQQRQPAQLPQLDLPQHGDGVGLRSFSPNPLDLFGDPFGGANGHEEGPAAAGTAGAASAAHTHGLLGVEEELRIPSPPPLPAEWDVGPRAGMLFDFDQFDVTKRQQPGTNGPLMTVTAAMNPLDVLNPSDDYIWQILFAGENDAVPKRVTAHLHHPPASSLGYLDDGDPLLDAILGDDDLDLLHGTHHDQQPQGQQGHGQQGQQQQGQAYGGPHGLGAGMVPMEGHAHANGNGHPGAHGQQHPGTHGQLGGLSAGFGAPKPRNGFGGHGHGELAPAAVKLDHSGFL